MATSEASYLYRRGAAGRRLEPSSPQIVRAAAASAERQRFVAVAADAASRKRRPGSLAG